MKIIAFFALIVFLGFYTSSVALSDEYIPGYYRNDGTYVAPHYRSSPDSNPYNNFGYPGNTNPYTGKVAPGNPDNYIQRYNNPYSNPSNTSPNQNPYGKFRR